MGPKTRSKETPTSSRNSSEERTLEPESYKRYTPPDTVRRIIDLPDPQTPKPLPLPHEKQGRWHSQVLRIKVLVGA